MPTDNDKNAARILTAAWIACIGSLALFCLWLTMIVFRIGQSADPIVDRVREHCGNVAAEIRRDARAGHDLSELRAGDATWVCTGTWDAPSDPLEWARMLGAGR